MLRGEREYRRVQPQEMTMDIINDSYLFLAVIFISAKLAQIFVYP